MFIDNRLREWRDWRFTRDGYGYRTVLGDLRENRGASGGGGVGQSPARTYPLRPGLDPELLLMTDAAVRALDAKHQRVVLLCYAGVCTLAGLERICSADGARKAHASVTVCEISIVLSCHRDTVYARLHSAHQRVMELLNDYAADVKKYRAEQRRARRRALDRGGATPTQSRSFR